MGAAASTDVDGKRSVLGRAFDILDCFFASESEQTISTLCNQTGLPPATVHRMLASLVEWGAIERTSRGHYRLRGVRVLHRRGTREATRRRAPRRGWVDDEKESVTPSGLLL